MAKNLLDVIQQNSQAMLNPAAKGSIQQGAGQPSAGETTDQIGNLLRTGQTGQEQVSGSGPKQSAIGEKLASQQTQQGLGQITQQADLANAQQKQQDDAQRAADAIQNEGLEQKRQLAQESYNTRAEALLQDYKAKEQDLDLQKDKARTEQMGFLIRLGNKQYIQRLQAEGAKDRLVTQSGLDEAIARQVFADESDLVQNDLSFKSLLGQKNRDVMEALGNIDLESAIKLAYAKNQAANESAMWTGVGGIVSAGARAYANSPPASSSTPSVGVDTPAAPQQTGASGLQDNPLFSDASTEEMS